MREANIDAAKAQYEAAKSVYENVVRNAVREVEEALATLNSTAQREADVAKAADRFQISYAASQARYQASLANLFELEEARRASLQAENSVFTLQNERVLAWISLYHAMGGGWTAEQNTLPQNTPLTLDRGLMPQAEGAALEDVQPAVPAPQETKSLTPVP